MSLQQFMNDESGQSMVEYGVTLGAVAAVSYIAVIQLGDKTADLYAWMANHLPGGETGEEGTQQLVRLSEGSSHGLIGLTNSNEGAKFDSEHLLEEGNLSHSLGNSANILSD